MTKNRASVIWWFVAFALLLLVSGVAIIMADMTPTAVATGTDFGLQPSLGITATSSSAVPSRTVSIQDKIKEKGGNGAIGIPVIKPKIAANTSSNVATFNEEDVRQFVGGFKASHIREQGNHTIELVELITSKQASKRLSGESIGLPSDSLVYLVTLKGSFSVDGAPSEKGPNDNQVAPTQQYEHIVFDATTGNLLLWGVSDKR